VLSAVWLDLGFEEVGKLARTGVIRTAVDVLNILGVEWNKHSTSGHDESGSSERKHGEKTTAAVDKQFDAVSGLR
jgi:hypothetical protein